MTRVHPAPARVSLLDAALERYLPLGWRVLPVEITSYTDVATGRARLQKKPASVCRRGWKDATTDPAQVRAWFEGDTQGWQLGGVSGPFVVIDLDRHRPDEDGVEWWAEQIQRFGDADEPMVLTAGRGEHHYFRADPAMADTTKVALAPGVEVFVSKQFVVLPPSEAPNGTCWTWEVSRHLFHGCDLKNPPEWLVEHILRSSRRRHAHSVSTTDDLKAFLLGRICSAAGIVDRRLDAGKWALRRCPNEDAHATPSGPTSTVLFGPGVRKDGSCQQTGYLHCSHAHCDKRRWAPSEIGRMYGLDEEAIHEAVGEARTSSLAQSHGAGDCGPGGNAGTSSDGDLSWEPPVDFTATVSGPPVPLDAFPKSIGAYIAEVAESYQIAPDFVALATLGVLSAAAARRAEVAIGQTHREPLNLYVAPTAESGERKQAIRALTFPIEEEEARQIAATKDMIIEARQRRAFAERRVKYLQDKAAKEKESARREELIAEAVRDTKRLPAVPAEPRLVIDDATPEYLGKALAEQGGRIAMISEEAGSLFEIVTGKYTNGVSSLDVHLKAYDGGAIRTGRISRGETIVTGAALTILVTPQPRILDRIAGDLDLRERGMLARFLFVLPVSRVGTRLYANRKIERQIRHAYDRVIRGILDLPLDALGAAPRVLRITGAALAAWTVYADDIEVRQRDDGDLATIRDWCSKHAGRVARIAGLFHLVENPTCLQISEETVVAARIVAHWLEQHALVAFTRMGLDSTQRWARKILEWIRRRRKDRFTLRDLHQHHRSVDRPDDLLPPLRILEARNFIRQVSARPVSPHGGRPPSPVFVVNPLIQWGDAGAGLASEGEVR